MVPNQIDLNRGLSSNFCWLRSANQVKFTEECMMCSQKHVLRKKCLQISSTWLGHYEPELKNQSIEWKHTDSDKENILVAVVSKDGQAGSLLRHERIHHYQFPCKRYNCKQCFILTTLKAKFPFFIE